MSIPGADSVARSRAALSSASVSGLVPGTLSRLDVVDRSPSTNTRLLELAAASPDEWPHLSALVADHQTAGRGRAGRSWETPQGAALTVSIVLRPSHVARSEYGWAPLVVGLAVVRALRRTGVGAWLKWPNDVVVESGARDIPGWGRWRKAVGILCETVPGDDAIVAGIGINVSQSAAELPVPHAASLATLGASSLDRVALLRALAAELRGAMREWEAGGPPRDGVAAVTATLGWDVSVDVPGGAPVSGQAVALSPDGALVLRLASGEERVVLAGDVRVRRG